MESSFTAAHRNMLRFEGGFSNHPQDPGGVTLEGVIQTRYDEYRRWKKRPQKALTASMRLTPEWILERDEIYRHYYWLPAGCRDLPVGVDAAIYDYAVNSGPSRAVKVLQRLVGADVTGTINDPTIKAAWSRNHAALINSICDERMAFLRSLKKLWPVFGRGWAARVNGVRSYALAMAVGVDTGVQVVDKGNVKGMVPAPTAASVSTAAVPAAASVPIFVQWWNWISDHPVITMLLVACVAGLVYAVIDRINQRRNERQTRPMPSAVPLPEQPK